ncbi:hypothetical protein BY996DRAFT_4582994 [Phakopsora pachyrhizi]|nr:hypothetical protein BY996DRAFT_4582994 [Phakopsora pachyrhizi]
MNLTFPTRGSASLTHYDLPLNYLASCGCSYGASYHPTAALSSFAYSGLDSKTIGPGPACGRCFKITLISASEASPPFVIPEPSESNNHRPRPTVVIKVVDKCPSPVYCSAAPGRLNKLKRLIHFDLAVPSPELNLSFFPSNQELYGYSDFGVCELDSVLSLLLFDSMSCLKGNVDYETISCETWSGWSNESNLGVEESYPGYQDNCCPRDPGFVLSPF